MMGVSTTLNFLEISDLDAIQTSGNYWMNNLNLNKYFKVIPVGLGLGYSPKTPIGATVILRSGYNLVSHLKSSELEI